MKARFAICSLLVYATLAMVSTGCVKLQNKVIMKGEWELVYYQLDTINDNYMEHVLPGYNNPPGCCKYMIDFQENDKVVGYYYVNDTLNYSVEGTWSLDEKSELYIDLDKYVNALFEVDRQNRKTYQLSTDVNTIDLGTTSFQYPITLDIKRRD